jgi:hypothetical protein
LCRARRRRASAPVSSLGAGSLPLFYLHERAFGEEATLTADLAREQPADPDWDLVARSGRRPRSLRRAGERHHRRLLRGGAAARHDAEEPACRAGGLPR